VCFSLLFISYLHYSKKDLNNQRVKIERKNWIYKICKLIYMLPEIYNKSRETVFQSHIEKTTHKIVTCVWVAFLRGAPGGTLYWVKVTNIPGSGRCIV
jgi:hypothetical protein